LTLIWSSFHCKNRSVEALMISGFFFYVHTDELTCSNCSSGLLRFSSAMSPGSTNLYHLPSKVGTGTEAAGSRARITRCNSWSSDCTYVTIEVPVIDCLSANQVDIFQCNSNNHSASSLQRNHVSSPII
jgi:hypothetical protein